MVAMPVVSALQWLRQEDHEFKASLGYTAKPCLKKEGRKGGKEEGREEGRKEVQEKEIMSVLNIYRPFFLSLFLKQGCN
jgi:predicted transposase YdaD